MNINAIMFTQCVTLTLSLLNGFLELTSKICWQMLLMIISFVINYFIHLENNLICVALWVLWIFNQNKKSVERKSKLVDKKWNLRRT